jgi:guanylate kinase
MAGNLYVVAAPSGAGKTTLVRLLLEHEADVHLSVSFTTRVPRPGEVDGRDYHFVAKDTFDAMRARRFPRERRSARQLLRNLPRVDRRAHGRR